MLCKRFVFTDDITDCLNDVTEFTRVNKIECKTHRCEIGFELETDTDDENLYSICSFVSENVLKKLISNDIVRFINYNYNCFNSDECKLICRNVLEREFSHELPGRIYVFIKVKSEVNLWSFYRFMCRDIQANCIKATIEEADKIMAMNDNSDFIDLLKCFSNVSMEYTDTVELTCDMSGIHITSCKPRREDAEFSSDNSDVLAELVTLNPRKIEVLGKEEFLRNDISSVITAVFSDRIEYR